MFQSQNTQEALFTKLVLAQRVSKTEKEHLTSRLESLVNDFDDFIKEKFSNLNFSEKIILLVQGSYGKGNAVKKVKCEKEQKYNDCDVLIVLPKEFQGQISADQLVNLLYDWLKEYAKNNKLKEVPKPDDRCVKLFYSNITFDFLITIRHPHKQDWVYSPVANKDSNNDHRYSFRQECPERDLKVFNQLADLSKTLMLSENHAGLRNDDLDFTGPIEESNNPGSIRLSTMFLKRNYSDEYSDNPNVKKSLKSHLLNSLALKVWSQHDLSIDLTLKMFNWIISNLSSRDDVQLYIIEIDPNENIANHLNGEQNLLRRKRILKWAIKAKHDFLAMTEATKPLNFYESAHGYFDEYVLNEAKNNLAEKFNTDSKKGDHKYKRGGTAIMATAAVSGIPSTAKAFFGGSNTKYSHQNKLFKKQNSRITLEHQAQFMKEWFPQFKRSNPSQNKIQWAGELISPISGKKYKVKVTYGNTKLRPKVFIEDVCKDDPHIYKKDLSLCLFFPESKNWNSSMYIGKTIMIWTINWIVQREVYNQTGKYNADEVNHG